ncbi:hypothetical protein [Planobispora rosea]|uniref:hypothetical protein n=1 Tax=Planobispora rosea TaxID=35762 RepID=UPI00083A9EE8|nr:hypothetical protein [Planobispora rosea]
MPAAPACPPTAHRRAELPEPGTPRVPEHLTTAPSLGLWLEALAYLADAADRRRDWRTNIGRLGWQLASRCSRDMATAPKKGATWEVLAEESGIRRRCLAYGLAWMHEVGLLVTAESGSTVRYRPGTLYGRLDDGLGNRAAVYILTIPWAILSDDPEASGGPDPIDDDEVPWPVETLRERPALPAPAPPPFPPAAPAATESCAPLSATAQPRPPVERSCTPAPVVDLEGVTIPNARARRMGQMGKMSDSPTSPPWPATVTPGTKAEMLAACERLRADDGLMAKLSARHLRSLLRPLWKAGATVRDIQHVLNHRPDGQAWFAALTVAGQGSTVRSLPGWIRHRISLWLTADGALAVELPSQRSARLAAAQRAEQTAFRAAWRRARQLAGHPVDDPAVDGDQDLDGPLPAAAAGLTGPAAARAALVAALAKQGRCSRPVTGS